jgi:hypothetical protein
MTMPSTSKAQKGFMGAELARLRSGEQTDTGMSESQLKDFAEGSDKGLPERAKPKHKKPHVRGGRKANPRGGIPY